MTKANVSNALPIAYNISGINQVSLLTGSSVHSQKTYK
jgi:hypothetical protein